jgi:hypothetical protein
VQKLTSVEKRMRAKDNFHGKEGSVEKLTSVEKRFRVKDNFRRRIGSVTSVQNHSLEKSTIVSRNTIK